MHMYSVQAIVWIGRSPRRPTVLTTCCAPDEGDDLKATGSAGTFTDPIQTLNCIPANEDWMTRGPPRIRLPG